MTGHDSHRARRRGAVAVVERRGKLLVIRRSLHVAAPGAYCFPGGGIEPGEDEPAALRRELLEELGAEVSPVRRLWSSVTEWGVELHWWRAELTPEARLTPNPSEVAEYHWLAPAELESLEGLLSSNHAFLAAWRAGEFELNLSS